MGVGIRDIISEVLTAVNIAEGVGIRVDVISIVVTVPARLSSCSSIVQFNNGCGKYCVI